MSATARDRLAVTRAGRAHAMGQRRTAGEAPVMKRWIRHAVDEQHRPEREARAASCGWSSLKLPGCQHRRKRREVRPLAKLWPRPQDISLRLDI
jgi:hypothetical protein